MSTSSRLVLPRAVLGVTSAGAVAGGAATKAVLSAVAGGIVGSKLAVNKELLAQQAMEAIQAQMRANMQLRKATIITNMTNTVDKYPLELGLSDFSRDDANRPHVGCHTPLPLHEHQDLQVRHTHPIP